MRLETVANFLPTPPGTSKLGPCSEHLQLRCWNVPASSADHPGPSGTPQWQCSTAGGQSLPENARKVLSTQLTVTMPMWASEKASVWCPSTTPCLTFEGNERRREYTETPSNLIPTWEKSWQQEQIWRASPLSYSSFPWQSFLDFRSWLAQHYRTGTPFPFTLCFV